MRYWFSCLKMTIWVETDRDDLIIDTAPITHKFVGQPINNLRNWMKKFGGFKEEKL